MPSNSLKRRLARLQQDLELLPVEVPAEYRDLIRQHIISIGPDVGIAEIARRFGLGWARAHTVRGRFDWARKCIAKRGAHILEDETEWTEIWRGMLWGDVYED